MRSHLGRLKRTATRSISEQLATLTSSGDGSTLSLDFTLGVLDPRFTFTRSTTATYINSSGYITTMAAASTNDPTKARFDYDPTTLTARGLLIEGSATNLLYWSESFDTTGAAINWNWSSLNVTRGTVTTTAPSGASATVVKIQETTATGLHAPLIVYSSLTSSVYTVSLFAKAVERQYLSLFDNGGSSASAMFNLSGNGTVVSESTAGIATIKPYPNGWYRITMRTPTLTNINLQFRLSTDGTTTSYAGTLNSGVYIWGAQMEAGSGASSYIPTGASQVARASDSCVMTGTNFSSWYGSPTASSVLFEGIIEQPASAYRRIFVLTSSASPNTGVPNYSVGVAGALSNRPFLNAHVNAANNVDVYVPVGAAVTNGTKFRVAARAQSGSYRISRAGQSATSTYSTDPGYPAGLITFGFVADGVFMTSQWISRLIYYPFGISDSQMDAWSA